MLAFTQHLADEHRTIEGLLETLGRIAEAEPPREALAEDLGQLLGCLRLVLEECHHAKEEEILFPALDAEGVTGGPHCSLYMGIRMQWDPIAPIRTRAGSAPILPAWSPRPESRRLIEKNSLLGVPLEEHEAGHAALGLLGAAGPGPELRALVRDYRGLMEVHIGKEDRCLFAMADQLLPAERQRELLERARELERRIGEDRLRDCAETHARLRRRYG